MDASPSDSVMKMDDSKHQAHNENWELEKRQPERKRSGVLNVVVSGLALFSDGYNAQISRWSSCPDFIVADPDSPIVGYMEPLFSVLSVPSTSRVLQVEGSLTISPQLQEWHVIDYQIAPVELLFDRRDIRHAFLWYLDRSYRSSHRNHCGHRVPHSRCGSCHGSSR